jgi:hypothetical protein
MYFTITFKQSNYEPLRFKKKNNHHVAYINHAPILNRKDYTLKRHYDSFWGK